MTSTIKPYLVLIAALSICLPGHAEKAVAAFGSFNAFVADNFRCADRAAVVIRAADAGAFTAKRGELARVVLFARSAIALDCAQMSSLTVTGIAGGKTVYSGAADSANQWQLVDATSSAPAEKSNTTAKKSGDAFDAFRDAGATKPAQTTATATAPSRGAVMGYHCSGNLHRYTGSQLQSTDPFEFRGEFVPGESKFRVINVMRGPLFTSGSTYPVLSEDSGVATIAADSTNARYKFQTVQLDREADKLTGKGGVSFDEIRSRVRSRLEQMGVKPPPGGSPMGADGLDGLRRVEIDGACVAR